MFKRGKKNCSENFQSFDQQSGDQLFLPSLKVFQIKTKYALGDYSLLETLFIFPLGSCRVFSEAKKERWRFSGRNTKV